jgi:thiol-disulfide isomerase/thioredoxin
VFKAFFSVGCIVGLLAIVTSCDTRVSEPSAGQYRATLELPGGEAPFGLEVANEDNRTVLYLLNGAERTRVSDVRVANGELHAHFPGYENRMSARIRRDSLEGSVTLIKAGGVEQVIPLKAERGQRHRFFEQPLQDNADVAGRWAVTFTSDDGTTTNAVAILEQQHDRVAGTVMTPTGDHRFLEGQVQGDLLRLSTFAGGLAYLYELRVVNGELQGDYWQGLKSHEKVAARRNPDAQLVAIETTVVSSDAPLAFTFNDVDGKPVSFADDRFRGKVVVVTLGGTWCPNCHDEAAFLVPFYEQHKDRGFEIIALMFERHGEFEKAAAAVRSYQRDLKIRFPVLIAGVADDEDPERKLPALSGVYGYPTAIFLDRRGQIRKVHTGFMGPATGKHYEEYTGEFKAYVDELLSEPIPSTVNSERS